MQNPVSSPSSTRTPTTSVIVTMIRDGKQQQRAYSVARGSMHSKHTYMHVYMHCHSWCDLATRPIMINPMPPPSASLLPRERTVRRCFSCGTGTRRRPGTELQAEYEARWIHVGEGKWRWDFFDLAQPGRLVFSFSVRTANKAPATLFSTPSQPTFLFFLLVVRSFFGDSFLKNVQTFGSSLERECPPKECYSREREREREREGGVEIPILRRRKQANSSVLPPSSTRTPTMYHIFPHECTVIVTMIRDGKQQ